MRIRLSIGPVVALLMAGALCRCAASGAEPPLNLLIFGDWGAATYQQKSVADAMASYVSRSPAPFAAAFTTGDNFYYTLLGTHDPQWKDLFEDLYDARRLPMPFYAALGNHDYDGANHLVELAYARQNPASRWKMPARWYRVDFPAADPTVTVLVLDSNKPRLSRRQWLDQLDWMESHLASPTRAPWIVCVAHHTIYSNGWHGDNAVLQRDWGELFERYNVPFYLCGHDHNLQHLQVPGLRTSFLVTGAGGAWRKSMARDDRGPLSRSVHGFVHLEVHPDRAAARFVDTDGQVIHHLERRLDGTLSVLLTTGTDPVGRQEPGGAQTD